MQIKACAIEVDPSLGKTLHRTRCTPVLTRWIWKVVSLSLCQRRSFVAWPSSMIAILLIAKVSTHVPSHIQLGMRREIVIEQSVRKLDGVCTWCLLVLTHMIDQDHDHKTIVLLQRIRECEGLRVRSVADIATPIAQVGLLSYTECPKPLLPDTLRDNESSCPFATKWPRYIIEPI